MAEFPNSHVSWTTPNPWKDRWMRFWMRYAGLSIPGRMATQLATVFAPPHKERIFLSKLNKSGYISCRARLFHENLVLGDHVFIDDHALLFQRRQGGAMHIGQKVCIFRYNILETGYGGTLEIDQGASIHPKCQINAYVSKIYIGAGTMLAPCCALYSYDHGISFPGAIREQPLTSRGGIHIGRDAWLGYGCIVLDGVTIGDGAVIGAGSVVTGNIPDHVVAVGNPARVVKHRRDIQPNPPQDASHA